MRRTNKLISFVLALVMILSSMSITLFASAKVDANGLWADPKTGIVQNYVTDNGNANAYNATVLFDWLDKEILPPLTNDKVFGEDAAGILNTLSGIGIKVNLTSVDNILKTLDTLRTANTLGSGIIRGLLGGYGLVTKNWTKDQSRAKTGDAAILNNLVKFLADNQEFLGAFVANKTGDTLNMNVVLGSDIPTLLKKEVSKLIYGNESAANRTFDELVFECALGDGVNKLLASLDTTIKDKYVGEGKNEVWTYLYTSKGEGGLGFKFEGSLDGFTYNKSKTLDATITDMINAIYVHHKDTIKALFTKYGQSLQNAVVSSEWGAPFASLLKLNTTDLSFLDKMSMSNSLTSFNAFAGAFVAGVTTYTGWSTDVNFGQNFQNMFKWAIDEANKSGVENNPYKGISGKDFSAYALALAKIIVKATVTDTNVVNTLNTCNSAQEVITKLLPVLVTDNGKAIVGKNSKTYEQVLGDILGYYINNYAILYTDTANKTRYTVSSGKTYLEVLNYAANYYLCDLNFDTLLGVDLTKGETFLSKLDKLQAVLFTGTKTLQYSKASVVIPGVVNAIMNLDFASLVKVGFEDAFTSLNKGVSAANLVCYMLNNTFKGVLGVKVFDEKYFDTIEKMLSNDSLQVAVSNLLVGLNNRKAQILPVAYYLFNALSDQSKIVATVSSKVQANGKAQTGNIAVYNAYYKDSPKKLVAGTDYTVKYANNVKPGTATVVVTGIGNYSGSITLKFNIVCEKHNPVAKVTKAATYTAKGTRTYTCSYCGKVTKTEAIDYLTPATVTGLKASNIGIAQLTLSWSKVTGATAYEVYRSTDGKTWAKIATVTANSCSATGLKAATNYKFKVRAVSKYKQGAFSAVVSAKTTDYPVPAKVTGLKASGVKLQQITLSWTKVSGATSYEVYMSTDGKKWTKLTTTTANSYVVKSLKAGTKYKFKVRAITKYKQGAYSDVLKTGTKTKAPTKVTVKSNKAKQATVTWKKAAGATKYVVQYSTNKNFKKNVKTKNVTKTNVTLKKLTGGKKIYVRVIAVNAYGVKSAASSSANVKVKKK